MQVQLHCGPVTIIAEGDKQTEIFEQLSELQDVYFERKCQFCGSENLIYRVRKNKDEDKFYEVCCTERGCWAKCPIHVHKKGGGMYVQRKVADENKKDNTEYKWGWEKFTRPDDQQSSPQKSTKTEKKTATSSQKQKAADNVQGDDVPF